GVVGLVAFAVGSAVIGRSLALMSAAPTLGGSFTTAALNVGATAGPLAGGAAITTNAAGPVWVALTAVVLAMVPAGFALRLEKTRATETRG
ncbi:hypothetical protein KHT87_22180, partial [Alkalihalobacillus clausii]|uniref:hypothetical protein n=1 Tax=Shouchella clausii TaxID=79880 RepID=UPI0027F6A8BE|nr:hypothetical protein [Shouchella clausii]